MNSEEDEFRRIEREALRRAAQDEDDDDTQVYTSDVALAANELRLRLQPMHPELRKMWEDYFDKCFRAQPEQEPVCPECKAKVLFECVACSNTNYPPKRPWVGLTEDEAFDCKGRDYFETYKAIEAKLKERNG